MTVSDEYLYSHLPQAERALMARVPPEGELSHEFSRRFRRRMSALIRYERRSPAARTAAKLGKIAAVLLLTLAVSFGAVIGTDTEARAEFLAWVREIYEENYVYRFFAEQSTPSELPTYEVGWLPQGYAEADRDSNEYSNFILYLDEEGNMLYLEYVLMESSVSVQVYNVEPENVEQAEVNGIPADFYRSPDPDMASHVVWADEESGIMLMVGGNADKSVILHIAESVYLAN
ncbi:MAG: DUF4367 domain-containing protein [Oscillospiraceae bacterium]|nr:DUF4367 domain-containing protein [Oscillospiraceae bacterium]